MIEVSALLMPHQRKMRAQVGLPAWASRQSALLSEIVSRTLFVVRGRGRRCRRCRAPVLASAQAYGACEDCQDYHCFKKFHAVSHLFRGWLLLRFLSWHVRTCNFIYARGFFAGRFISARNHSHTCQRLGASFNARSWLSRVLLSPRLQRRRSFLPSICIPDLAGPGPRRDVPEPASYPGRRLSQRVDRAP